MTPAARKLFLRMHVYLHAKTHPDSSSTAWLLKWQPIVLESKKKGSFHVAVSHRATAVATSYVEFFFLSYIQVCLHRVHYVCAQIAVLSQPGYPRI